MVEPRYDHLVKLPADLEAAWQQHRQSVPALTFNGFIRDLIREALCVNAAETSTTK